MQLTTCAAVVRPTPLPAVGRRPPALLVLVLLAAGCGLVGGSAVDDVVAAARATTDEGTARIAITTVADAGVGQPKQRTDATGLIDFAEGVTQLEMRVGAPQLAAAGSSVGGVPLILIGDGDTTLMRSPSWPQDRPWARTSVDEAAAAEGFDTTDLGVQMELLGGGVTGVDELGESTVRGVTSTHLRMDVDLEQAAQAAPDGERAPLEQLARQHGRAAFPIEVWIGEDHVRRLSYVLDVAGGDGTAAGEATGATVTTVIEYFDFGVPFEVALPDNVVDASELPTAAPAAPDAPEAPPAPADDATGAAEAPASVAPEPSEAG